MYILFIFLNMFEMKLLNNHKDLKRLSGSNLDKW